MVLQVHDVVAHEKLQSHRRLMADRTDHLVTIVRNLAHDMREVPVVGVPEPDEVRPIARLVMLELDPEILRVRRKRERAPLPGADKPLMVVRRRVDEMVDGLTVILFAFRQ